MAEMDDSHISAKWEEFIEGYCADALRRLESEYPTKRSLLVDFGDIQRFDPEFSEQILDKPDHYVAALEQLLRKPTAGVQNIAFEPHARIFGVPENDLLIQNISSSHIDKLITIKGVINKRADVHHKVRVAIYRCLMCEHILRVPVSRKSTLPEVCPECKRRSLKLDEESSYFVDIQRAEAQELLERVRGGTPAARLELYCEDDLVNVLTPGETVAITGIIRLRPPQKPKKGEAASGVYTRYLEILAIESTKRDFEEITITPDEELTIQEMAKNPKIFEDLSRNIAPGIYGHDEVKLAITLQMFGGTKNKRLPGGEPIRDDVHMLLIGDPGSAKSRLLQYAKDLAPKGVYVSGKSVTGAGLTASAEKDEMGDGGWTLKAGALVLASGGMAAVDEFDKIDENERAAMHEVMESQTVSVAKAGIVAQFKAKCSILAAANPKFGRFNPNQLPAEQFDIPPTLLSRFDLIFTIYDILDPERDSQVATKILSNHQHSGTAHASAQAEDPYIKSREMMRKYIAYARRTVSPQLTNEAVDKIKTYYVDLRSRGSQTGSVPITARYLEGLVRLSEASAKIRLSPRVEAQDAERAIALQTFMMDKIWRDKETGQFDVDIVSTGRAKSQVDKIQNVLGLIKQMQAQEDLVEINKVIEAAGQMHINEADCRRIIDEMLYKGELYKAKPGFVKIVKQYG